MPLAGPLDFSVSIDADPGDVIWVICSIHPSVRMKISVVPANQAASDPAAIEEEVESRLAVDQEWALATHKRLQRQTSHRTGKGKVVDVFAGYDSANVSLLNFYPSRLRVKKGQRVRWHFGQLVAEIHTASFAPHADEVSQEFFTPYCAPDGDAGAGPDTPPELPGAPFCSDPAELEFDVHDEGTFSAGDGRHTSRRDFEHSGIRGHDAPTDAPWTIRFKKASERAPSATSVRSIRS